MFLPHIHDNPHDPEACVSGELRYQRKSKEADFVDEKSLRLSQLRKDEWTKYELRSGATRALYKALDDLYTSHARRGAPRGVETIVAVDGDLAAEINALGSDQVSELLGTLLRQTAVSEDAHQLVQELTKLGSEPLSNLRHAAGVAGLRAALAQWPTLDRDDEASWQQFLEAHPWILAQAFCQPVVLYRPGASVSPPTLSRRHQQLIDFVYTNTLTRNLVLVEIKTPATGLVTQRPYRGGQIYAPSAELVGAVAQISAYRHSVKQHAHTILRGDEKAVLRSDPLSVVVAGDINQLDQPGKKETFEQYRRELRNIDVLTFDELKDRAERMLQLFEASEPDQQLPSPD